MAECCSSRRVSEKSKVACDIRWDINLATRNLKSLNIKSFVAKPKTLHTTQSKVYRSPTWRHRENFRTFDLEVAGSARNKKTFLRKKAYAKKKCVSRMKNIESNGCDCVGGTRTQPTVENSLDGYINLWEIFSRYFSPYHCLFMEMRVFGMALENDYARFLSLSIYLLSLSCVAWRIKETQEKLDDWKPSLFLTSHCCGLWKVCRLKAVEIQLNVEFSTSRLADLVGFSGMPFWLCCTLSVDSRAK